jgi:hypothetical protein
MAFNPFHRFRKHQKVFFAILTIICMITFVFQFGAGDPFTRIMGWFGYAGARGKGPRVATLYGEKIHEGALDQLRRQRRLVQDFLTNPFPGIMVNPYQGIASAQFLAVLDLVKKQAGLRPGEAGPIPATVDRIPDSYRTRMQFPQGRTPEQHVSLALNELHQIREAALLPSVQDKPEQLKALETLANAIAYEAWFFEQLRLDSKYREEFVFGGSSRPEDLLDFLIWTHQADKLGISLTETDVIREINRMAGGRNALPEEPFERNSLVRQFLSPNRERRQGATPKELFEALLAELRVQLAQEAILGHGQGVRAYVNEAQPVRMTPTAATPDEFLAFFREHRTTLKVALLPINVADFTSKVTEKPSEEVLQHLYDLYKDKEPKPDERLPGFKEPRRVRLQFASVSAESPFYVAEAKKMAKALAGYSEPATSAALRVAAGVNLYPAGSWPAWAAAAALPNAFDPLLQEYERYRDEEAREASRDARIGFDLRDRSPVKDKPQVYAALVGQFLGAGLTGPATPVAGASLLPGVQALYERTTLRAFGSAVLAGGSGSPLTALALPVPFTHAPLPRAAIQALLMERFEKDLAPKLLDENLKTFRDRLAKLKGKPAEAKKYVETAAKEFGFQNFQQETEPKSIYEIARDPSLKQLQDAWDELRNTLRGFGQEVPSFPDFVFGQAPSSSLQMFGMTPMGVYQPTIVLPFGSSKDVWLAWYTEDKPARVREFADIRGQVADWWRFDQARLLAREEAKRIDDELKAKHLSAADAVRFLREQKRGTEFELNNVAMLIPPPKPQIFPGRRDTAEFRPYEVPADKIAYPAANFVQQLLTLKAPGDSRVIADKPSKHYYVTVLLERSVPTFHEFRDLYAFSAKDDPIWQIMMDERRRDFYRDLMRQMRVEAAGKDNVNADGTLKLPENVRNREGSTEGGE